MTSEDWLRALLAHHGEKRHGEAEWARLLGRVEDAFPAHRMPTGEDFSGSLPLPCTCCLIHRPLNDHA